MRRLLQLRRRFDVVRFQPVGIAAAERGIGEMSRPAGKAQVDQRRDQSGDEAPRNPPAPSLPQRHQTSLRLSEHGWKPCSMGDHG
jgi:hypothetical protein